jgi:hypothetical protein
MIEPNGLPKNGYTDPDDIMFAEVFITSNANALVTGKLRHYKPCLIRRQLYFLQLNFSKNIFLKKRDKEISKIVLLAKSHWLFPVLATWVIRPDS